MAWVNHQLPRSPVELFDANAFYPYPRSLAFSEHLFVPSLLAAPWIALSENPVLAHNAVVLVTLALGGLGMFLLCRELTGDSVAAFAAGLLYAFHTWNVNEIIRIQILSNQWFPFLLLALVRYVRKPGLGRAGWVGLAYVAQALSCMYWALYLPYLTFIVLVCLWWRRPEAWRRLPGVLVGLAPAVLLSVVFAIPYLQNSLEFGFNRSPPEPLLLDRYLDVLRGNWLYEDLLGTARVNQNAAHFLGFVTMGLAGLGLLPRRKGTEDRLSGYRPMLVVLVVVGFLLSLGHEIRLGETVLAPGPYALFYKWAPGFTSVRYPERLSLLLVLGLAPLLAGGVARLRSAAGTGWALAVTPLILIEHLSVPLPLQPIPTGKEVPQAHRWIAEQPDVRVVAEVPSTRFLLERFDADPMYLSTVHWKRTLQGFTGYFPPAYNFIRWRLFHFPHPESVRFLQKLGVDTVIVHPQDGRLPRWAVPNETGVPRRRRAFQEAAENLVGPFPEGHLVVRLRDADKLEYQPPEPVPQDLVALEPKAWETWSSRTNADLAIDRDPDTAWSTGQSQIAGDYYAIRLPEPATVARISLEVRSPYDFPMNLEVLGKTSATGGWIEIPFEAAASYERLFALLLYRPREAALDIDIEPQELVEIKLRVKAMDPFAISWTMAEVHLYN